MIATYAWNYSPIDGTNVVHNIPAKGCKFKFPFDLVLDTAGGPPLAPLSDSSTSILAYIQHTSAHVNFARRVVQFIAANHRQAHQDCVNER
jgi:hypothetical protein